MLKTVFGKHHLGTNLEMKRLGREATFFKGGDKRLGPERLHGKCPDIRGECGEFFAVHFINVNVVRVESCMGLGTFGQNFSGGESLVSLLVHFPAPYRRKKFNKFLILLPMLFRKITDQRPQGFPRG